MKIIKQKVQPPRNRELRAEVLAGAHNWKQYYEQNGIHISGLVPNPRGHEHVVNHCWRFIRRSVPLWQ